MEREEKWQRIAWENQTIPILFFPLQCRTQEQLPLSPEDPPAVSQAASNPSEPLPAPALLRLWASCGIAEPSWGRERLSSWQHHLELLRNKPYRNRPASAAQFSFYLPLGFGAKVCFAGKFLTRLSCYICILHSRSRGCYYYLFEGREKKNPINANCDVAVSKP